MTLRLRWALLLALLAPGTAFAQGATISGVLTDDDGEPLPGAQVTIPEFTLGASSNLDGEYSIEVPAARVEGQEVRLVARFLGFRNAERVITLAPGPQTQNFQLEPDPLGLDEVVVTGVASGTPQRKLGFSIGRVDAEDLQEVPATDPVTALRGKVAGVTIVQASGDPSSPADIRLRGTTSLGGNSNPLIIIDGIITEGSIRDINMEDVESIEVIKGAAAASLYGSLAGNGVIQIRTRRGSRNAGRPEVRVRSETGFSSIADAYPSADRHPYVLDSLVLRVNGADQVFLNPTEAELAALPSDTRVVAWNGREQGIIDPDGLFDNPFPVVNDNVASLFTGQPFSTNYVSVGSNTDQFRFLTSFENFSQGGVLEPVDDYTRNTFRVNADYLPSNEFEVNFSGSYIDVGSPNFEEQGQGDNFFYSALVAEPFIDLTERDADDGDLFSNDPTGYDVQGSNFQNPLYVAQQREFSFDRTRLIGGITATYRPLDWLSLNGRQSLDRSFVESQTFFPVGYVTPTPSNVALGSDARGRSTQTTAISELWAQATESFGDINTSVTAKYLYEDREFDLVSAGGTDYVALGIRDLSALNRENITINSFFQEERAENFFVNLDLDYADKYIFSGLVRQDGSSSFGEDERYQTYYRLSGAYRVTEDFRVPGVDEFKLRASYGISGQRPPFSAQYETFNATTTGISPGILGNRDLRPSEVQELEVGFNAGFLNRFALEVNYADTVTENDYLLVPLPAAAGFAAQWQNIGQIESNAFEAALSSFVIQDRNLSLDFNLTFSRIRQQVTDLGDRPPFTIQGAGALPLFRVEEGINFGAIFGNEILTSIDDLTFGEDGSILNQGNGVFDADGDGSITRADFEVNGQGFVVPVGTSGTEDEQVVYLADENGERAVVQIGDTQPDFQVGFTTNFNFRGFGIFTLLDWVQGADVYNYTKQLLFFNDRHQEQVDLAMDGFDYRYSNGSSEIYNAANASSYFVEDASFLKLRELAVSYTVSPRFTQQFLGNRVQGAKISLIGRNLLTFTDYSGWDPEVALRENATNYRLDEFAYPNFRTFTAAVDLRF